VKQQFGTVLVKGHKTHFIVPSIQRLLIKCIDDENNEEHKFCRGKFALKSRFEEEDRHKKDD
jgi:hypothetical protein